MSKFKESQPSLVVGEFKKRLNIYAKLLKDNLTEEGCEFIMQRGEHISRSMIMQFYHKHIPEQTIHKFLDMLNCNYRLEYGKDIVTILLQEEIKL